MALQTAPGGKVDRQTTTPFLLKLFYRTGSFHRLDEFHPTGPLPPHLQIYTWSSCTLRELSHLLTSALPTLLPDPVIGTRLAFRLIFPDTRSGGGPDAGRPGGGRYVSKELGSIVVGAGGPGILPTEDEASIVADGPMAGELGGEPDKSLGDARFVIGDYVSCAIFPPLADGSVAPVPGPRGPGGPGGLGLPGRQGNMSDFGGGRGGVLGGPRENGFGGFRVRGGPRMGGGGSGGGSSGGGGGGIPSGEWRRGERLPDGPAAGGGRFYGRGRGRDY
ncbi:hypothetical protein L228DRAFT_281087 [Xylona heveae TC161]|uniref:Sin3 associated polypeptide p18 n=1 Tax=Xylona heveae (strain CBS 132557 / TC161) TaxID=1328760 RepID=A0A165HV48_XYLHT|nr:hypothetical protein L228DRAFT_281087 [Xylona heveae TC161]KZF23962.1 hypothetical protein L228DRAFT_281087 [Xylona heveae TC161]